MRSGFDIEIQNLSTILQIIYELAENFNVMVEFNVVSNFISKFNGTEIQKYFG